MLEQYKFQKLIVYQLSLDYVDKIYSIVQDLPEIEKFNLVSQIRRAATSIPLNIAEGSTGQSDLELNRFLGLALRSYLETIACLDLISLRDYLPTGQIYPLREDGHQLFMKLVAFRKRLRRNISSNKK